MLLVYLSLHSSFHLLSSPLRFCVIHQSFFNVEMQRTLNRKVFTTLLTPLRIPSATHFSPKFDNTELLCVSSIDVALVAPLWVEVGLQLLRLGKV